MNPLMLLNGYKTIIGLVVLGVGSALEAFGIQEIGTRLREIGGIVAGVGALHGGVKKQKAG